MDGKTVTTRLEHQSNLLRDLLERISRCQHEIPPALLGSAHSIPQDLLPPLLEIPWDLKTQWSRSLYKFLVQVPSARDWNGSQRGEAVLDKILRPCRLLRKSDPVLDILQYRARELEERQAEDVSLLEYLKFIFICLCHVAHGEGVSAPKIDRMMRGVQKILFPRGAHPSQKSFRLLRKGAAWGAEKMDYLRVYSGWKIRSGDLFYRCGFPCKCWRYKLTFGSSPKFAGT